MRSAALFVAVGILSSAAASCARAETSPASRIWMPESHVVCDRDQQACFDSFGLSLGYTEIYFGEEAEQALLEQLRQNQEPDTIIQPETGVDCSLPDQFCRDQVGASVELTRIHFSDEAANQLGDQLTRKIYVPESNVACDMDQSICFDNFGYSLGYTDFYLGQEASQAWLSEIQNGREPDFIMSPTPDVDCDLRSKVCVDVEGASVALTEEYFGAIAAANLIEKIEGSPRLEGACRDALAARYRVEADTISLEFARSDEGGSAYGFDIPDGRAGVCRVLDNGTIDYIQGS